MVTKVLHPQYILSVYNVQNRGGCQLVIDTQSIIRGIRLGDRANTQIKIIENAKPKMDDYKAVKRYSSYVMPARPDHLDASQSKMSLTETPIKTRPKSCLSMVSFADLEILAPI
jgi:hypothetical protein